MRGGRRDGRILFLSLATGLFILARGFPAQGAATIVGTVTWGPQHVSDAVVHIERTEGAFQPPQETVIMDQRSLAFVPHVLPILKGAAVNFLNSDGVLHNLHAFVRGATLFNIAMPKFLKTKSVVFQQEGPVLLLCDVHREMSAYILVLQNPFFALTDAEGRFVIKDVPPGSYTVRAWHENLKPKSQEVDLTQGQTVTINFKMRQ